MKLLDAKWCWSFLSGVLGNAGQCWDMLGNGHWPSLSLCFQTELEILPTRHYPTQVLWTHLNIVLYSEERNLDNSDENQHLDLDAEWRALRAFIGSNWAPAKVEWPPVWSQETPSCDLGRHHLVFSGDTTMWSWGTSWWHQWGKLFGRKWFFRRRKNIFCQQGQFPQLFDTLEKP